MEAHQRFVRVFGLIGLAIASLSMTGCGLFAGAGTPSRPTFVSGETGDLLTLTYPTGVYVESDTNTADLYFSTINGLGQPGVSMNGVSGSVLHVHLFLKPRAGRTPIDFTAANITVTHVLIADGAVGVYGGAGFMLPSGDLGSSNFGGRLRDVTLRPTATTDGFADRLGWNELGGTLRVVRDPEAASRIASWVDAVVNDSRMVALTDG